MVHLKQIILSICLISVFVLIGCKKIPEYGISNGMKQYFSYKPGSYWIYRDDSSGAIDSAYVTSYSDDFIDFYHDSKIEAKVEIMYVNIQSKFLLAFAIERNGCGQSDYAMVSSRVHGETPPGMVESKEGPVVYYPGWPENQKIIPECLSGIVFFYRKIPSDTVNNVTFNNIIYSEIQSRDSSLSDEYYHHRKISFAENAGIIKYFEIFRHYNIHSSYTLLRYKVVK